MHEQPTQPKKENNTVRNTVAGVVGAGVAAFGAYKSADVPAAPSTEAKSSITTIGGNSERKFSPDQSGVYTIDVSGDASALTRVAGERRDTEAEQLSSEERIRELFTKPGSRYRTWIENEARRQQARGEYVGLRLKLGEGEVDDMTAEEHFAAQTGNAAKEIAGIVLHFLLAVDEKNERSLASTKEHLLGMANLSYVPEAMLEELLKSLSPYAPEAIVNPKLEAAQSVASTKAFQNVEDKVREYAPNFGVDFMRYHLDNSVAIPQYESVDVVSRTETVLRPIEDALVRLAEQVTHSGDLQAARETYLTSMIDNLQRMYEVKFQGLDPKSPHYANLVAVRDTVLRELRQDYLELVTGKHRK